MLIFMSFETNALCRAIASDTGSAESASLAGLCDELPDRCSTPVNT